jgi:hypothetical protein
MVYKDPAITSNKSKINISPGIPRRNGHRNGKILKSKMALKILGTKQQYKSGHVSNFPSSSSVAREFGVSPKTVRDIWNGRTWRHVAQTLSVCCDPEDCKTASNSFLPSDLAVLVRICCQQALCDELFISITQFDHVNHVAVPSTNVFRTNPSSHGRSIVKFASAIESFFLQLHHFLPFHSRCGSHPPIHIRAPVAVSGPSRPQGLLRFLSQGLSLSATRPQQPPVPETPTSPSSTPLYSQSSIPPRPARLDFFHGGRKPGRPKGSRDKQPRRTKARPVPGLGYARLGVVPGPSLRPSFFASSYLSATSMDAVASWPFAASGYFRWPTPGSPAGASDSGADRHCDHDTAAAAAARAAAAAAVAADGSDHRSWPGLPASPGTLCLDSGQGRREKTVTAVASRQASPRTSSESSRTLAWFPSLQVQVGSWTRSFKVGGSRPARPSASETQGDSDVSIRRGLARRRHSSSPAGGGRQPRTQT